MNTYLSRDIGGEPIQAIPLRKNFVNLITTSKVIFPKIIHSVVAGDVVITWEDGTTSTVALTLGDLFSIEGAASLAIS